VLTVRNLLLSEGGASAEAVSALAQSSSIEYMRVRVDQSSIVASFRQAGYPPMRVEWSTFMIKPLTFDTSVDEARRLFGIDTE
jgi:hypothetical protein